MNTIGTYVTSKEAYQIYLSHSKYASELILVYSGQIVSAYKHTEADDFRAYSDKANKVFDIIKSGLAGCKSKNAQPVVFTLGTETLHTFEKAKNSYMIGLFNGEVVEADIETVAGETIKLKYVEQNAIPSGIPYTVLTRRRTVIADVEESEDDLDAVAVRSVAEIALEKDDITWLNNKMYYVIKEDKDAEVIFKALDNYSGVISYDTETTGLKINCFGKIGSKYKANLEKYNAEHPDKKIRADKLVGIIFCVQDDVSYYFPCANRKFKNLYSTDTPERREAIRMIKERYSVKPENPAQLDMYNYINSMEPEDWGSDVILMERVRMIIEKGYILAHNGAFEYKVGLQYGIDTNLKEDTMIMHQLLYKFRGGASGRGESSTLKYLSKHELGIDQWELSDFFPDYKEDDSGIVKGKGKTRGKKQGSKIDFSYMDEAGARVYAPADGDCTLGLFKKYKADMMANHHDQEYIYSVEIVVACAIGYMEFYGHRIDESKILGVRDLTKGEIAAIVSEIRQAVEKAVGGGWTLQEELDAYNELKQTIEDFKEASESGDNDKLAEINKKLLEDTDKLYEAIAKNEDKQINLASPAQVSELFYDVLGYPLKGDKKSVAKKQIKHMLGMKNEDGTPMYPVAVLYSEYKSKDTLNTKFFDNLPDYMYNGGYIFSSFGQISTNTGRMSCKHPNAQQYPKAITGIVVPRDGYVCVDADYSQIEYRVITALAKNVELAKLFSDPDSDYHTLMASMMYDVPYASVTPKQRGDAKSFNFGIPYGMGYASLAVLLTGNANKSSIEEAKEKTELYFKNQPNTRKFFDNVKEMAQVNKYTKTHWSRYRYYQFEDENGVVDSKRKAAALRQAGNAVIQGTAADIFKISVARNFMYIRQNHLLGQLLIINMIHDEQLFEIDADALNVQRVLADIGRNMQFKVEGFPPLYIGAGIGPSWGKAKGKMTEIHPVLLDQLTEEANAIPLKRDSEEPADTKKILDYFADRVYEFRRKKVYDYLTDPNNIGKDIHPAIGNLLNLQFTYGRDKKIEGLSDNDFTLLCVDEFCKHNNIEGLNSSMFTANQAIASQMDAEAEEEKDYEDDDEADFDEDTGEFYEGSFSLVDESNVAYGATIQDLIAQFKYFVSPKRGVCGLNTLELRYDKKDAVVDFLMQHLCEPTDNDAMELVFLTDGNILNRTGIFVNNIKGSDIEARL